MCSRMGLMPPEAGPGHTGHKAVAGKKMEFLSEWIVTFFFSCDCLTASMARSVDCLIQYILDTVQVHLIGAEPIVQVKK